MAYTPINWQTGQTITAEKLNKMDNGWSVESSQILSETVTTAAVPPFGRDMGEFDYNTQITADTIIVTFDGTPYTCTAVIEDGTYYYGDADLISTPFFIWASDEGNFLRTPSAGTYTVAISASSVEISSDFGNSPTDFIKLWPDSFLILLKLFYRLVARINRQFNRYCLHADTIGSSSVSTSAKARTTWFIVRETATTR